VGVVEVQERVAVPEPVILAGVIAPQVRPAGTVSVRLTAPPNPLTAVTVTVELAEDPALAVGEVAAIVKLVKLKVAVVECVVPVDFVSVIVTTKLPAVAEEQVRVAVPELVRVLGVMGPQVRELRRSVLRFL
jgi:hypothetical protein